MAEVLIYADVRGIHSHGATRVGYYAERVSKDGINREPEFRLGETGPCSAISYVDNTAGQVVAKMGMEHVIKTAQQDSVAVAGISRMGHNGAISYSVWRAAHAGLVGIPMCQSGPMAVSFGGAEIYYGTNPLVFATSGEGSEILIFDMVTIVQAWGRVFDARSRSMSIPGTWAADKNGAPTTDPFAVYVLLPTVGPKGYGLIMMTNALPGVLLGLPFERQVSSTYDDLHAGRNLGQLHVVINPNFSSSSGLFRQHLSQAMRELSAITPAPGLNQVYYPGQDQDIKQREVTVEDIEIAGDIYQYPISDALYNTSYETRNPFAQ